MRSISPSPISSRPAFAGWRRRFLLLAWITALLAAAIGGFSGWWIAFHDADKNAVEWRSRLADYYADGLSPLLWRYDITTAQEMMRGALLHENLIGLRVEADGGRLVIDVGATGDEAGASAPPHGAGLVILSRPLAAPEPGGQTIIGVATFLFRSGYTNQDWRVAWAAGTGAVGAAALLLLGGLIVYRSLLAPPLGRLQEIVARHSDENGNSSEAIGALASISVLADIHHDLTRRLAEESRALSHAKAASEEASRVKSAFLANISHELRTPLNGVIGLLTLMLEHDLPAELISYARSALVSAESLLGLVNDLLDITQLEAGKMPLRLEDVNVRRMLDDVATLMAPRALQRGDRLRVNPADDLPALLRLDSDKLRRILINLLANAVKFTKDGEITVSARLIQPKPASDGDPDAGAAILRLEVADTGIGIDSTQKEKLFQRFVQLDQSATRSYEGSGLGLAICRELCQLMSGRIGVDSEPGLGSTFWVELPTTITRLAPIPTAASTAAPTSLRVLVVDDIALNRLLLMELLRVHGHDAHEADSGVAAITTLTADPRWDLVLMDVEMPGMDGATATKAIRALSSAAAGVAIMAITAYPDDVTRRLLASVGVDYCIGKPIRWPDLNAALTATLTAAEHRRETAANL